MSALVEKRIGDHAAADARRPVAVFQTANRWMQEMIRAAAPPEFEVRFLEDVADTRRVRELLSGADFFVTVKLPAAWAPWLGRCRLVQLQGVGYDGIDRPALAAAGIPLAMTPAGTIEGVAEHTILLILALNKRLTRVDAAMKRGEFDTIGYRSQCHFFRGQTLGIVGFGRIGRRVAQLARAFEAQVIYSDVVAASPQVEIALGARHATFEELLATADIVSVHTPLNSQTRGLFDATTFAHMKPGSLFINTARGETYSMDALADALGSGHLGGAGLDVFDPEPPPADHPLFRLANVICTPHMATGTVEAHHEKAASQFANFRRVLNGEPPRDLVPAEQE
jgi:phosphoglycerate dehydrogenase-like enzyme